jgi:hypothetical protein
MKITLQRRLAKLAGLLLLSLLVFAIGLQAAQARTDAAGVGGSGSASSTTAGQLQFPTAADVRLHEQGITVSAPAATAAVGTQGRGGFADVPFPATQQKGLTAAQGPHAFGRFQPTSNRVAAQAASADTSSTSAWIAAGSAAALVVVGLGAWALMRRRRQPGESASAAYCAQHPEDALCMAA